jgi:hypothetical protein
MTLTIYQKSVYSIIYNATMISRSIGKSSMGRKQKVKNFKIRVFEKLDNLTDLMNNGKLTEGDILKAITVLSNEFQLSFGQAQKPINVILKYHFYLSYVQNNEIKKILHCPVDSVILKALKKSGSSLTKIDKGKYLSLQREIQKRCSSKIEFDTLWDEKHLRNLGII